MWLPTLLAYEPPHHKEKHSLLTTMWMLNINCWYYAYLSSRVCLFIIILMGCSLALPGDFFPPLTVRNLLYFILKKSSSSVLLVSFFVSGTLPKYKILVGREKPLKLFAEKMTHVSASKRKYIFHSSNINVSLMKLERVLQSDIISWLV